MGCGPSGLVDRAIHLETGQQVELEGAVAAPAVGPGVLYAPGIPGSIWRLPEGRPAPAAALPDALVAPPATDGISAVVAGPALQRFALEGRLRYGLPGTSAPWYTPAISGPWSAWVALEDGAEVIWIHRQGDADPRRLADAGHPRHVAASEVALGWIEDGGVVILDLASGERRVIAADAHTSRRLTLWGAVACWEAWTGADVDAACSDGLSAGGPGHQRNPSRWEDRLLFVQDGRTFVAEVGAP